MKPSDRHAGKGEILFPNAITLRKRPKPVR
jgi:hypothetical protein